VPPEELDGLLAFAVRGPDGRRFAGHLSSTL
jgi:hypothetical protein